MAKHEHISEADENALNAAQVAFTANPLFMAPQAKYLLQAQGCFLDEVGKFSAAWLRRRQDAIQSMIDTTRRIALKGQSDPAITMKEIVEWRTHSMERLSEDAKDCSEMLNRCVYALVSNEVDAMEEMSKTVKRATKASQSEPT